MDRLLPYQVAELAAHHFERHFVLLERVQRPLRTGQRRQQAQVMRPVVPVEQLLGPPGIGAEEIGEGIPHGATHPDLGLLEAPRLAPEIEEGASQAFVNDLPAHDEGIVPVEDDGAGPLYRLASPPRQ